MNIAILAGALALLATGASAHEAPSGVQYPFECCSNRDCFPVHYSKVRRIDGGWIVTTPDGPITFRSNHVRPAIDDQWHACWVPGTQHPLCLIPAGGGS